MIKAEVWGYSAEEAHIKKHAEVVCSCDKEHMDEELAIIVSEAVAPLGADGAMEVVGNLVSLMRSPLFPLVLATSYAKYKAKERADGKTD